MSAIIRPLQDAIIEALSGTRYLTREQLLDLTFTALDHAIAGLIDRSVVRLEPEEGEGSHLDRFVLN